MDNRCLYCYQPLEDGLTYHEHCSIAFFGIQAPPKLEYSLDMMDELARHVVERSIAVPGVQPKISMSLVKKIKDQTEARLTVIGALDGHYIFKPPSDRFPEMPANEHVTMRIAEAYGIRVVPSSLIRLASGELSYITRRIDRTNKEEKIHMLDMFQVTEAFDKYRSSMEKVGKALLLHSANPLLDAIYLFEITVFSFITGNNDMHLKNFSMIESPVGWVLAPAYDMLNVSIVHPDDTEEIALTLAGKKSRLRRAHFEDWGKNMGMTQKQIQGVFTRLEQNIPVAWDWLDRSFLSPEMRNRYKERMTDRLAKLDINVIQTPM